MFFHIWNNISLMEGQAKYYISKSNLVDNFLVILPKARFIEDDPMTGVKLGYMEALLCMVRIRIHSIRDHASSISCACNNLIVSCQSLIFNLPV